MEAPTSDVSNRISSVAIPGETGVVKRTKDVTTARQPCWTELHLPETEQLVVFWWSILCILGLFVENLASYEYTTGPNGVQGDPVVCILAKRDDMSQVNEGLRSISTL